MKIFLEEYDEQSYYGLRDSWGFSFVDITQEEKEWIDKVMAEFENVQEFLSEKRKLSINQ